MYALISQLIEHSHIKCRSSSITEHDEHSLASTGFLGRSCRPRSIPNVCELARNRDNAIRYFCSLIHINQLPSWYGTTFRKKSRKLFRGRDLILMKLKPDVSLAGSSTNSPFRVFLSTRGPEIAQAWQKSIGVKTLTIWVCVSNLRPLYNF